MTASADRLIELTRQNRDGAPPEGDILGAPVLVTVLRALLERHLQETEPEGAPERYSLEPSGVVRIPAQPAAERLELEDYTVTARELATFISHLEDIAAQSRAA